jgi:hypothetical protein
MFLIDSRRPNLEDICQVCDNEHTRKHKCQTCSNFVHLTCGDPIGEEGSGQYVKCWKCHPIRQDTNIDEVDSRESPTCDQHDKQSSNDATPQEQSEDDAFEDLSEEEEENLTKDVSKKKGSSKGKNKKKKCKVLWNKKTH